MTGARVGSLLPPSGSSVTITASTPLSLPGTSTDASPARLTENSAFVGFGVVPAPCRSQTW
jgi:hypothetical protein